MYKIALKMLLGDKIKFITLVASIVFATVIITQFSSVFTGVMRGFSVFIQVTEAPIWVMESATDIVDAPITMPDTFIDQIRSIDGIEWAQPFLLNKLMAKLANGEQKIIQIIGVDSATLVGLPQKLIAGDIKDINKPDAIILDQTEMAQLGNLWIGDSFEINDRRATIVGIVKIPRNTFSYPVAYTTYDKAKLYSPPQRNMLSYILAKAQDGYDTNEVNQRINEKTGLLAITSDQFTNKNTMWYLMNTGIPVNIGILILIGTVVSAAIASQTFYSFTMENLRYFAVFKALGTNNSKLTRMVLLQSMLVWFLGFGIGLGIVTIFGSTVPRFTKVLFHTPYQVVIMSFLITLGVCMFSSLFSIRKISGVEPAIVFRG